MANVMFKKGLLTNLPKTYAEGTFYVTTDERAIYLDVSDSARIRLGDFIEVANTVALPANANVNALYYVTDINCLAKWNGAEWIQINRDTGMTSVEVTGDGNAVTAAVYDATGRKLTLTKGATYMTAADVDGKISAAVGEIPANSDGAAQTVRQYVDAKTSGIASDEALTALGERVTAAEGEIDTLQGDKTIAGSVDKKIDDAIKALDLANTYDAKGAADAKDDAIAAAKKAGDDAQADVDALEAKVGTVADGKTVVQLIDEAKTAATYDDTALKGRVSTLEGEDAGKSARAIAAEETAKIVAGADTAYDTLKEISDWISSHKTDAGAMNSAILALEAIVDGIGGEGEKATVVAYVTDAIAALKIGDYAKAADLTELAGRVSALEGKSHEHANKALLDTYTQTEANLADAVAKKHSHTNAAELDKIADGDKAKWDAAAAKAHEHANKAVLDGITAEKVSAWDGAQAAAEATAKAYTDAALTWGSF